MARRQHLRLRSSLPSHFWLLQLNQTTEPEADKMVLTTSYTENGYYERNISLND
jgi:hypothetical protein